MAGPVKRAILSGAALVCLTTPAAADPIFTPLLVAALTAAGVSAGTAVIVAPILGAIVITAAGLGLSLLFSSRGTPAKPENATYAVQQPIPFRIYGYGTARVPGATVLKEPGAYNNLAVVNVLNGHLVDSFVACYLNDDLVQVPIVDGLISGTVATGADGRYGKGKDNPFNVVQLNSTRGLVPEKNWDIIGGIVSNLWPKTCRGDGCASLQMVALGVRQSEFSKIYPYQAPQPSAVLNQYRLFDPRNAKQTPGLDASYVFAKNAALAILHFECFSDYGPRRKYATAILPVLDLWLQAINDCDVLVPLKAGGTEPRYQLGGFTTTEQDRRSTLQAMLAACDGHFVERGDGTIILRVGVYRAPTVTLTDDDIVGFMIQRDVSSEEKVNRATAKYTDPANAYITVETVPMNDLSDQAIRPGPIRSSQLDLTWVQSVGQASRLLKREMTRSAEKTRGTLTLNLSGMNACFERWVLVQSNSVPRLNGTVIEIRKPTISLSTMTIEIEFMGSGPQVDAYNAATDESPPQPVAARSLILGPPIPQNVSVVPEQNGSSIYLNVSWDAPSDGNGNYLYYLDYQVGYAVVDAKGNDGPIVNQTFVDPVITGGRINVSTSPVPTGSKLDVGVVSIATGQTLSTQSQVVRVDTSLTAPGPPTAFTAKGGAKQATLSCTNPTGSNFASVQFYRAVSGGGFASSSSIGQPVSGQPGAMSTFTDMGVNAGTYDYYVTAASSAGINSEPVGPATVTVSAL